jgi:hypothetical protein
MMIARSRELAEVFEERLFEPDIARSRREQPRRPGGQDGGDAGARHAPQRGPVEMIVVQVRDQHAVERARVGRRRYRAADVRHAPAQHRVGEEPGGSDLDQHGRVPKPGDPSHCTGWSAAARWRASSHGGDARPRRVRDRSVMLTHAPRGRDA